MEAMTREEWEAANHDALRRDLITCYIAGPGNDERAKAHLRAMLVLLDERDRVLSAPVCVIKGTKAAGLTPAEQIANARVILAHYGKRVRLLPDGM